MLHRHCIQNILSGVTHDNSDTSCDWDRIGFCDDEMMMLVMSGRAHSFLFIVFIAPIKLLQVVSINDPWKHLGVDEIKEK